MIKALRPWPVYLLLIGGVAWIGTTLNPSQQTVTSPAATAKPPTFNRLTAAQENTFAKVVRENGYICNRVISSRYLLSETGASLVCESWTYDFHQKAGRWAITPRKLWGQ